MVLIESDYVVFFVDDELFKQISFVIVNFKKRTFGLLSRKRK